MKIPEDVKEAINEMFLCKNLMEHMGCFQHFYEELKDCTFVVFSEDEGTELPEALHSNYDNDFAIIVALDIWKNHNKSVLRTKHEARLINESIKLLMHSLNGEKLSGARWLLLCSH